MTDTPCPNAAQHQPHPSGYVSNSSWADDALLVATQATCPGCGRWEIWVPKRPDLRIAVNWPPSTCDWGNCDAEGVAERRSDSDGWLPVCADHIGPVEEPVVRGACANCDREYVVTVDGTPGPHQSGRKRCPGSGMWVKTARVEAT